MSKHSSGTLAEQQPPLLKMVTMNSNTTALSKRKSGRE